MRKSKYTFDSVSRVILLILGFTNLLLGFIAGLVGNYNKGIFTLLIGLLLILKANGVLTTNFVKESKEVKE